MHMLHQSLRKIQDYKRKTTDLLETFRKFMIYERIMHSQISMLFDSILSKYQFGFRQDHDNACCY